MTKDVRFWQRELYTQSEFSFFIKAVLNFLREINPANCPFFAPTSTLLQVPPACHIYRHLQVFYQRLLRIANCTTLTLGMCPSPPFSQFKPLWAFTFPNSTQSPGDHSQRNTQLERRLRKKLEVVLHHRCPNHTAKTRKAHWGGNGRKKGSHISNISLPKCMASVYHEGDNSICFVLLFKVSLD